MSGTKQQIKLVMLDIEGTTTPISFVADVLFPYVRAQLKAHLESKWGSEELTADIAALRKLAEDDRANGAATVRSIPDESSSSKDQVIQAVMENVFQMMDVDRKTTALKQLQGHIWNAGYHSGDLKGEVYEDVLRAFKKWQAAKVPVYIYSSGSIHAQKLIFGFSDKGDLLPYLAGHFDTTIGLKVESQSYNNIFTEIHTKFGDRIHKSDILFVTDNHLEAQAASEVSMNVLVAVRPGNKELPAGLPYSTITTFDTIHEKFEYVPL